MTEAEFLALNPAHNRPVISASRNNTLKIPVDRIDRFKAAMAEHAAQKRPFVSWQPHTLQPGESLAEIAGRGGLTVPALLRANGISAGTHLLAGTRLLVPTHRVSDENLVEQFDGPRLYQQVDAGPLVHRVRRGETGASIARRYGLTLAELRAMNRRVSPLKPGMTLTVRRSQKQTVLVAEDGSRKVISRQAAVPATATAKAATASSGSHTAIRLVHYSPARTQTGSSNTAASRSTASRLDSRVTLRSDRSAARHTLRQSGKTTVALADTTSRSRSAAASTSTRSTTTHKSASTTTSTGKRLKAASASSATSRGSASGRTASTKAASAKSASSRKAVNSSNTRASSRGTATRTKAGSSRPRASHKVADAR